MTKPRKPPALRPGDAIRIVSLASPVDACLIQKEKAEIERLGYRVFLDDATVLARDGYFAGSVQSRLQVFRAAMAEAETRAIFCSRGGYGSTYLLDALHAPVAAPKILLGHSDITAVQIYLWQKLGWVTFHGPMVSSFSGGADAPNGYDRDSFSCAVSETSKGWTVDLDGESIVAGTAEGVLLGGCLTLIQTTLGTPWELDSRGAILVIEDRGMKPYQVDRALMHLKQAGKLDALAGVVLGDFPECDAPGNSENVKSVAQRILSPLRVPIVWGAAVGHTARPMRTLPFGVRARLHSENGAGGTQLEILESACVA
jgi:muramoyltetrapeptide carboxypeptidase